VEGAVPASEIVLYEDARYKFAFYHYYYYYYCGVIVSALLHHLYATKWINQSINQSSFNEA